MSNFKVDNLEVNTINGNSISSLGGSSSGTTMTEYSSINTGSIQGTDFPEVSNGDVKSKEVTITEDTQIRKINVTTKNLDGKLTVGDTVFEGTKADTSSGNTENTISDKLIQLNNGDLSDISDFTIIDDSHLSYGGAEFGVNGSYDSGAAYAAISMYHKNAYIEFSIDNPKNIYFHWSTDYPTYSSTLYVVDSNNNIIEGTTTPINGGDDNNWQIGFENLPANTYKLFTHRDNPTIIAEWYFQSTGPSIPTITKEIQLDSTTIDMKLDGTLDSVDYETFSGQDIDALSLVIDFITGDSTKQNEVINKLNKLKGE